LGGRELDLGGPRQRALLALLALSAGSAVPPAQLIDALWGDAPPPSAANTVQVYVSRLRRLLTMPAVSASPLRTVNGLYLLDVDADAVDALAFERRYEAGHFALAAGDPASAARELRLALALWEGPPLLDLAGTATGDAVIARLESLRVAALADRVDADAALGRHAALVPELTDLVRRHPFDERFAGQLMLALYRDGRQADALATYAGAAHRLGEELGVDPGPALRDLQRRVLAQDPGLLVEPAPEPVPEPALHAWAGAALPGEPLTAPLVGRTRELAQAEALLTDPAVRLVTLLGPGGAGKTRLARELLHRAIAGTAGHPLRRADFVPLAAESSADDVLPAICRALRLRADWTGEPPLDLAVRMLADQDGLLVLDNLEQLAGLGDIRRLLEGCPGLKVLATSRTLLRLPGERVVALGPLPLPAADAEPDAVRAADAVRLFAERARASLASFEVSEANVGDVAELCRRLDGLPLALELAAARIPVLPPAEILRRLDRRLTLLSGGSEELPERQRSMRAAVDWSVRLLEQAERDILAQLSVFVGGWTLDAAEQVCAPADPAEYVVDVIARLADRSLLVADGSGRMGMLETIRDYAAELLAARPEMLAATRDRHAAYYAALADELGEQSHGGTAAGRPQRERLDRESGNLRAALEYAGDPLAGDAQLLGRLIAGQLGYWFHAGRLAEAERWIQAARDADLPLRPRSRLLLEFGHLAALQGDLTRGSALMADAYDDARLLGDDLFIVRVLASRAMVARYGGHYAQSLELLEQALDRVEPLGAPERTRALELDYAELLDELGRTDEAVQVWLECRRWGIASDDMALLAYLLSDLGVAAVEGFDVSEAADGTEQGQVACDLAAQAIAAAQQTDSISVRADTLHTAGLIDLRTGRADEALVRLRAAVRDTHAAGQLMTLPDAVAALGLALLDTGESVAGTRLLATASAWRRQRSIAPAGRWLRAQLERAEPGLPEADRQRGERTPFGSMRGLTAVDPGLVTQVLDLRGLDPALIAGSPTAAHPLHTS
jgi:predicted ATPase/DNA-binding SARP family transcriptional activator